MDWQVGDHFEVLPTLFEDPTLAHPSSYSWGIKSNQRVIPNAGTKGIILATNSVTIDVEFEGLPKYDFPSDEIKGWNCGPMVHRHFRKLEEGLCCADCDGKLPEGRIDYLCGVCRGREKIEV